MLPVKERPAKVTVLLLRELALRYMQLIWSRFVLSTKTVPEALVFTSLLRRTRLITSPDKKECTLMEEDVPAVCVGVMNLVLVSC